MDKIKFLLKILVILTIVSIVDTLSGNLFDKMYDSCKYGICCQENYIIKKTNQDLLIFGSSRASYHYDSRLLSDSLGVSVYNCGREGAGIYFQYGALLATLKRYKPKVIFLEFDYRDIYNFKGKSVGGPEALIELAPYYHNISSEFDSLLVRSEWQNKIKLNSKIYRYNHKILKLFSGNFVKGEENILGFRGMQGFVNEEIMPIDEFEFNIDQDKIKVINAFIKKAKENNIKLVFTLSPYYIQTPKNLFNPLKKIALENSILILNHYQDPIFLKNKNLFHDKFHLNKRGAVLYSSIIASDTKKFLNIK